MRLIYTHLVPLLVYGALLLSGCTSPLIPAPQLPPTSRAAVSDAALAEELRRDWEQLCRGVQDADERWEIISRYNARLLTLLRRLRYDVIQSGRPLPPGLELVHEGAPPGRRLEQMYDDIVPAADVRTDSLKEHYVVPGVGVPLVGVIPAAKIHHGDMVQHFQSRGTVSTLTAVLEFPRSAGARPRLRLIPRHTSELVRAGRRSYPLAGDFSAPIEIYWNLTDIKSGRYLGLLNPQKLRDTTGLTCMERYNPQKIPVILTHGLASSAATFNNLVNRLLADPTIRHNYQFWYFNYPTGIAWSITAAQHRQALQEVRQHFDPKHTNRHWDHMVLIGHSMGGLITRLNQTLPTQVNPADLPKGLARSTTLLPALYNFRPLRAGQVVYMATPHRGAPIAGNVFVLGLMRLVHLPQTLAHEVYTIATLQEDNIIAHPGRVVKWFTSIGQLSPTSADIVALRMRPVLAVPTHSIIGDRGRKNSPRSSDGIVPYWSSHLPWGSESIVPADHSVQDIPEAAEDLKRILHTHLSRTRSKAHSH